MIFEAKPLGSYCTRFVTAGGFSPRGRVRSLYGDVAVSQVHGLSLNHASRVSDLSGVGAS